MPKRSRVARLLGPGQLPPLLLLFRAAAQRPLRRPGQRPHHRQSSSSHWSECRPRPRQKPKGAERNQHRQKEHRTGRQEKHWPNQVDDPRDDDWKYDQFPRASRATVDLILLHEHPNINAERQRQHPNRDPSIAGATSHRRRIAGGRRLLLPDLFFSAPLLGLGCCLSSGFWLAAETKLRSYAARSSSVLTESNASVMRLIIAVPASPARSGC